MVSVSFIGQTFKTPINFYAQPNISEKNTDKAQVKAFTQRQKNMGYAVIGSGALAAAGTLLKKGPLKYIAPIPAALVCVMMGANMIGNAVAINKAIDTKA